MLLGSFCLKNATYSASAGELCCIGMYACLYAYIYIYGLATDMTPACPIITRAKIANNRKELTAIDTQIICWHWNIYLRSESS